MKEIIKIILRVVLFIVILFILLMFRSSFASFFAKISGKSVSEVSEPIFILENTEKQLLNDEKTEVDYYFDIKNFNANNQRTETALKYYIEINPKLDSSIILTLYKDGTKINLTNQKTNYIEFRNDINETHNYRLNVKYDREKSNSSIDINESIYVKACAIQS